VIYKNIHKALVGLSFFIPLIIYIMTMAPTTSFWDCGEFIATSVILGVPHPPGAPLYLLLGNIFSSLPTFTDIGARVNLISPIASAFSVMFLYLIIVYLIEEYLGKVSTIYDAIIIYGSSFTAAITFSVTDAHWFNAVEAEVYSLSTFFTAIVVWMILKWSNGNNWNIRYLLIIIYMLGLAIGVHLLNLLALPFIGLIILFKKFNYSFKNFLLTILLTIFSFILIYIGIIKGIPDLLHKINGNIFIILSIPIILIISIFFLSLNQSDKKIKIISHFLVSVSIGFILLLILNPLFIKGTSQIETSIHNQIIDLQQSIDNDDKKIYQMTLEIESNNSINQIELQQKVNTLINNRNDKVDIFKNLYEQYFEFDNQKNSLTFIDLLKWQSKINLLIIFIAIALAIFGFNKFFVSHFDISSFLTKFIFSSLLLVLIGYSTYILIFVRANQSPRINENNPNTVDRALSYMNRDQYGDWEILNFESTLARPENTNWRRYTLDRNNPTFTEKMNFFFKYQVNEMYLRYFGWQFIGRGDKEEYPWYIQDIKGNLIGNQKLDGINFFRYGLPLAFILGILGLFAHFKHDSKRALAVLSLFLATGFLIILYLNQYDPQPRERDYSFVGSFFAYSIWIGIGLSALQYKIRSFIKNNNISLFVLSSIITITFIFMPIKMLATDYFEHNRSDNFTAWDYGYNLLNSCEPNGIIFTNGDNDTFPLWYLQEVENIRKDVNVVNLSLLNTPWYIEQLMSLEPSINFNFSKNSFSSDIYMLDPWYATEASFELCSQTYLEEHWSKLECNLEVDGNNLNFDIHPTLIGKLLRVQDYMILKLIHDVGLNRPIYFAATVANNNQIGLEKYLTMEGMTYRLSVIENKDNTHGINYEKMKKNLTQSSYDKIIYNESDYYDVLSDNYGVYRYRNLNDSSIYFNDNIQRLVQNYRIGFIRLAQYNIDKNNYKEADKMIELMNAYFPPNILKIEPGIAILVSDSIYGKINDSNKQIKILKDLFNNPLSIDTEIYLMHKLSELNEIDYVKEKATYIYIYKNNELNFELEKYIGDILSDYLEAPDFINYCHTIFETNHIVGLLYSLVRVYDEIGERDKAINILEDWLTSDPNNQDLIQLRDYMLQLNYLQ
tara:strand:- start:12544 stop:15909 length:3366 start_codon:yes stop_codon:yes gene_type:complete